MDQNTILKLNLKQVYNNTNYNISEKIIILSDSECSAELLSKFFEIKKAAQTILESRKFFGNSSRRRK